MLKFVNNLVSMEISRNAETPTNKLPKLKAQRNFHSEYKCSSIMYDLRIK